MCKIFFTILLVCSLFLTSCAGKNFSYNTFPQTARQDLSPNTLTSQGASYYQPEMEENNLEENLGGALLGLIGVALTVGAIVVPIVLLSK
ncbi:MAG: hypothetical protein ABII18_14075 [bacterium]|nr:hypothetical protein [bacterium]